MGRESTKGGTSAEDRHHRRKLGISQKEAEAEEYSGNVANASGTDRGEEEGKK